MAITEQKVWVTSKGTKLNTLEQAEKFEITEQLARIEEISVDWREETFNASKLANFLQTNPEAKPLVEAINHLYNQNPVSKTDAT